jgi:hypothetical protein
VRRERLGAGHQLQGTLGLTSAPSRPASSTSAKSLSAQVAGSVSPSARIAAQEL